MNCKTSIVAAAAAWLIAVASADTVDGQSTFYGAGGAGAAGSCMLAPGFNGVGITVALNRAQYEAGAACGKCIRLTGQGEGTGETPVLGPMYATVDHECKDCKFGDLDLGLGGDGQWKITWEFVDCEHAKSLGSNMPVRSGNRVLRGSKPEKNFLEPGSMVTKDGIRLIEDVVREYEQQQQTKMEKTEVMDTVAEKHDDAAEKPAVELTNEGGN